MAKGVDIGGLMDIHGGHFRLTSIVQKRLRELVRGARPLVDVPRGRKDLIDIVVKELDEGRIEPTEEYGQPDATDIFAAEPAEDEAEETAEVDKEPEAEQTETEAKEAPQTEDAQPEEDA